MPEDEGVNGDIWNNEASHLLSKFNWTPIGDANVDLTNVHGERNGIDRIFTYADPFSIATVNQGVFIEAKRYKTTSYQPALLGQWITTLSKKITDNRNSANFHEVFETVGNCILRNGVIVIWFSDYENYNAAFRVRFKQNLEKIKLTTGRKANNINRIYVLDNYEITRLAAVVTTIREYSSANNTKVEFHYPNRDKYNNIVVASDVLSLDYMLSKFILAQATVDGKQNNIVFYFGQQSIQSFKRLANALKQVNFIEQNKGLIIYLFESNDEFRKIKPDVEKCFEHPVVISYMEVSAGIPSFMKNKQ